MTAVASAQLSLALIDTDYVAVPGLSLEVANTETTSQVVVVQASGALESLVVAGADVGLFVDGVQVPGGTRRCTVNGLIAGLVGDWHIGLSVELAPGTHTIEIRAKRFLGISLSIGASALESRATLNVTLLND